MNDTAALAAAALQAADEMQSYGNRCREDWSDLDGRDIRDEMNRIAKPLRLAAQGVRAPGDGLRQAAQAVVDAHDRYLLAHDGQGHEGEEHDFTEPLFTPLCGNCVSQEYGTEADLFEYAVPALRAALAHTADCADCASHTEAVNPPQSASPVPLDRERLARAIAPSFGPSYWPGLTDVTITGKTPRVIADAIADAYEEDRTDG